MKKTGATRMDNRALVYKARELGRRFCCETEGSKHYKQGGIEPFDLMIAKGIAEDFAVGNMVKYAIRFKLTRNLEDLKKVSDYAHLLCGVEILKEGEGNAAEERKADNEIQDIGESKGQRSTNSNY